MWCIFKNNFPRREGIQLAEEHLASGPRKPTPCNCSGAGKVGAPSFPPPWLSSHPSILTGGQQRSWWDLAGPEGKVCLPSSEGRGYPHSPLPLSCFCSRPVSFPETPYTASPAGADKVPPYRQPSGSFSTPGSATYARYKPSPERSESLHSFQIKESNESRGPFFPRKRTLPYKFICHFLGFLDP